MSKGSSNFVKNKSIKRGKLIVLDGGDGSGKATQSKLLVNLLRSRKIKVKYFDFPQYNKFFGSVVGRFLAGEFGGLDAVSPYLAVYPYALDRWSAKPHIDDWLDSGGYIVCNRYTSSNLAYQTARVYPKNNRKKFVDWLKEFEYKILKIPKEDVVIYLKMPSVESRKLISAKSKRAYTHKKFDLNEKSLAYQIESSKMYLELAQSHKHWVVIQCADQKGNILPIASIHDNIVQSLCSKIPNLCKKTEMKIQTSRV